MPPTQAGALNTIGVLPALGCSESRGVPKPDGSSQPQIDTLTPCGCPRLRQVSPCQGYLHLRPVPLPQGYPNLKGATYQDAPYWGVPTLEVPSPQGWCPHRRGAPHWRDHTRAPPPQGYLYIRDAPYWGAPYEGTSTSGVPRTREPHLRHASTSGCSPSRVPPSQGYLHLRGIPASGVARYEAPHLMGTSRSRVHPPQGYLNSEVPHTWVPHLRGDPPQRYLHLRATSPQGYPHLKGAPYQGMPTSGALPDQGCPISERPT